MRTYSWWKSKKKRIRGKYTLCGGVYLSPKENKNFCRRLIRILTSRQKKNNHNGSRTETEAQDEH